MNLVVSNDGIIKSSYRLRCFSCKSEIGVFSPIYNIEKKDTPITINGETQFYERVFCKCPVCGHEHTTREQSIDNKIEKESVILEYEMTLEELNFED